MTALYDAGALIALERGDHDMWRRLRSGGSEGPKPITHGGVLGQAWRGGPRQARLARALPNIDVLSLDDTLGRRAGALLSRSGTSDVVDAALVALARDGDMIYTSDPDDIAHLASVRRVDIDIVRV